MPLIVEPIRQEYIPQCVEIRTSSLGLLVIGRPPPYPSFKTEQISSIENNLLNSKHVHFMKVVDTEQENEILAFAKYEVYEHGRPDLERLAQPASRSDFEIDEFGALREAAHDYFCKRNGEMGKHPHILLALLVTLTPHRRRGAGSLLLKWGIDLSERIGLPCHLQASSQGRKLYKHHGFEEMGTVEFDLKKFGLQGVEEMTEMIRRPAANPGIEQT